jgi:hypothetical protein
LLATHPNENEDGRYIARKVGDKWIVAFGHLNEARDAFLVAHIATQGASTQEFSVEHLITPQADTGFWLGAARAIDLALKDFQAEKVQYNVAVLPASGDQLYVYVLPALTKDGVYPLGGDERYTVSSDGKTLLDKRRMHKAILWFDTTAPNAPKNIQAGYHIHVLSNVPEDSDVFYVLTRKPSIPEFIGVGGKMRYIVNPDGSIALAK